MFSRTSRAGVLALISVLGGCGGGSGGQPPAPPPPASQAYAVGGATAGLSGTVVLQLNGGNDLNITANGGFTFPAQLTTGTAYLVTIRTQPAGQTCAVVNGAGTIATAAVGNVAINCANNTYRVSGTITGLIGNLSLQLNASENLTVPMAGGFQFTSALLEGAAYSVTIVTQPAGQTCVLANAAGTVGRANITNVAVSCTDVVGGGGVAGNVATLAGGAAAGFWQPGCVAVDAAGNIFVPEYSNNLIRKVSPTGVATIYAGTGAAGHVNGAAGAARFAGPAAVALDATGNLYVAENEMVRKIAVDGTVTTLAGSNYGIADGQGTDAMFETPAGIAVDPATGDVFVADRNAQNIRRITAGGLVSTLVSAGSATFNGPRCLALDSAGNLFVADTDNHLIRKVATTTGAVSIFAGSGAYGAFDGAASVATFARPQALAFDDAGNLYVADFNNNKIRKVTSSGEVSTFAGTGVAGSADGAAAAATFWLPDGIAFDPLNHRLVVADQFTGLIRTIEVH
jgi:hypothetical protein